MAMAGDVRCTFCGVDQLHAWKLVVGFGAVVCDGCVALCHASEASVPESTRVIPIHPALIGPTTLAARIRPAARAFSVACPFCDEEPSPARRLFIAETASICSDCIGLCEDIYEQERRERSQ